jgi:uncharacterized protein YbaP (TraB family)
MFKKTIFSLLPVILFMSASVAAAPVFKVTKGDDTVYIGGTFHLLTEKDYPLPDAFDKAYKLADELYFETNMREIETPEFQQKSLKVILYQDGQTLKTALSEATYARFVEYAKSRQIDPMQLNALNPTGVMLTITIMEYQARGFVAEGVDKHYFQRAGIDNKTIDWFESPDEQLAILDGFDNEDPNGLINYTLDEIKNIDQVITNLHKSWREGDMETLTKLGIDSFAGYPDIYKSVLVDRNNKWMKKIEAMFGDEGTELVLVGALHLPGADGVLTQLLKKGYKVEKL